MSRLCSTWQQGICPRITRINLDLDSLIRLIVGRSILRFLLLKCKKTRTDANQENKVPREARTAKEAAAGTAASLSNCYVRCLELLDRSDIPEIGRASCRERV